MLDRSITDRFAMARITISGNSLISLGKDRWDTTFPHFGEVCVDGCATCKPAVMRVNNPLSANTIFIGDGLSDRFAAQSANIVFAKSKLADHCMRNSIPYIEYRTLADVVTSLDKAFESLDVRLPQHLISQSEAA